MSKYGNEILSIGASITKKEVQQIVSILEGAGAVLPVFVWSVGFRDIVNGELLGGVPEGHQGHYDDYESAARQYLLLSRIKKGKDVFVLKPDRIIDNSGRQILP